VTIAADLSSALDQVYALLGQAAEYQADEEAAAAAVTVRFRHLGRDESGAEAVILVRVSEVADEPQYGALVTIGSTVWTVKALLGEEAGTNTRQWALHCTAENRAAWRKP